MNSFLYRITVVFVVFIFSLGGAWALFQPVDRNSSPNPSSEKVMAEKPSCMRWNRIEGLWLEKYTSPTDGDMAAIVRIEPSHAGDEYLFTGNAYDPKKNFKHDNKDFEGYKLVWDGQTLYYQFKGDKDTTRREGIGFFTYANMKNDSFFNAEGEFFHVDEGPENLNSKPRNCELFRILDEIPNNEKDESEWLNKYYKEY